MFITKLEISLPKAEKSRKALVQQFPENFEAQLTTLHADFCMPTSQHNCGKFSQQ